MHFIKPLPQVSQTPPKTIKVLVNEWRRDNIVGKCIFEHSELEFDIAVPGIAFANDFSDIEPVLAFRIISTFAVQKIIEARYEP